MDEGLHDTGEQRAECWTDPSEQRAECRSDVGEQSAGSRSDAGEQSAEVRGDPGEQNDAEEIHDSFICCVCLDLLHKPVALCCGHVSCFWCVHKSMNHHRESYCPFCRHPYNHFPTICKLLYFLLLKIYPVACKKREEQVIDEEKRTGYFSPQLKADSDLPADHGSFMVHEEDMFKKRPDSTFISGTSSARIKSISENECHAQAKLEERHDHISVADVQCLSCRQLLVHPVVLNCGHVFCESCVALPPDEVLRCQVCQSLHPSGLPKVCLVLDHFVQEHFSREYTLRKAVAPIDTAHAKRKSPRVWNWLDDPELKVHLGVGCDSCGVYPITGDRYKCTDCTEKIGFDVCGECYHSRSTFQGRFNQQHSKEHKFELVKANLSGNILLYLSGHMEVVSATPEGSVSPMFDGPAADFDDSRYDEAGGPQADQ